MPGDLEQLIDTLRRTSWSSRTLETDKALRSRLRRIDIHQVVRLSEPARAEGGTAAVIALYRAWIDVQEGQSPHAFIAWFNLGAELSALGDAAGSELCWRNALVLKSDFYQAAVNLGLGLEARGDTPATICNQRAKIANSIRVSFAQSLDGGESGLAARQFGGDKSKHDCQHDAGDYRALQSI